MAPGSTIHPVTRADSDGVTAFMRGASGFDLIRMPKKKLRHHLRPKLAWKLGQAQGAKRIP